MVLPPPMGLPKRHLREGGALQRPNQGVRRGVVGWATDSSKKPTTPFQEATRRALAASHMEVAGSSHEEEASQKEQRLTPYITPFPHAPDCTT